MRAEGIRFRTGVHVGRDVEARQLQKEFDAVLLAGGACAPRDLPVPGRELSGIHFAVDFLTQQNRRCEGDAPQTPAVTAEGRRVVIIGGGDTGADCLGTVHRQGARSVHQFELLPRPPDQRADDNPWPLWPNIFRVSCAHEEGGERVYSVSTESFSGDTDRPRARAARRRGRDGAPERPRRVPELPETAFTLDVDLVLLAMGFVGPERPGMLAELGVRLTERGTVWRDERWMTSVAASLRPVTCSGASR